MKSPLAIDKATVAEFKLTPEVELHPRQKIAFLEGQLQELRSILWRSRVDIIHAKRLQESENVVLKNKGLQNESEHRNQVEQFSGAVIMVEKLLSELKKENPGLGEVGAQDHPDSQ